MDVILVPIVALICVFGTPVAIVWLILRHRSQHPKGGTQATGPAGGAELLVVAEKMERRIDALEQILDAEAPGWRKRHHE